MQYDENAEKYGYKGEMTPLKRDELKVYVPQDGPYGLEPEEGGEPVEEETCYLKSDVDEAIAELKAENERLKAKLETVNDLVNGARDMMDCATAANKQVFTMRERRLRRALWLKRADDAKHLVIAYENYDYLDCQEMTIKQENARTWMTCKLRTAEEWVKVWKNVERKCLKKAEEYK